MYFNNECVVTIVKVITMQTVLVTGYAKAPQGTSMYEKYKHVGIILEIDPETDEIVNASFTFVSELTTSFFKRMVIGYNLSRGLDSLIECIKSHYLAPSQQAVIVALKAAVQRYCDHKN